MVAGFPLVPGSARNLFQFIKVWKSLEKKRCPWKYLNQFLKLSACVLQCMLSMACHVCFVHYCSKLHCVRQLCVIISNTHRSSCNTWTVLYWISTETCSLLGVATLRAYGKNCFSLQKKSTFQRGLAELLNRMIKQKMYSLYPAACHWVTASEV